LKREFGIKNIILYGRSMGAVSSLRYCEMDPNIKACVLDSPFCNFPRLCEEILSNKLFIPGVMARYLIGSARKRLLEKIEGFDIE
jgi:pimeloyl-ACP methyl ester carboxylesterase